MSNLAPFKNNPQIGLPTLPSGETIAQFATYLEAQRAVDYLSDQHFPVQAVTIVGVDLKMVERVTGRLTYGRAAMAGIGSGAYFGLTVGLLIFFFGNGKGFSIPAAVILGAAFGLLFGVISYSLTGGRRDFTSTSQIVAGEYRVLCLSEQANRAIQLLAQLAREGGPSGTGGGLGGNGGGPGGSATATVTPAPGIPTEPFPTSTPAGSEPQPAPAIPVTGPTYSEMIDKKKAEDRERAEAERAAADNVAAEHGSDFEQADPHGEHDHPHTDQQSATQVIEQQPPA